MVKHFFVQLWHLPRSLAIWLVRGYQMTLSPDHGPLKHLHTYGYCRHEPTCSMYALEKLRAKGLLLGSVMAMGRVLTCHPWRKPSTERIAKVIESGR